MPTLYEELTDLIIALDRHQIEYALCDGMAMAIHGHPRATVDIDLLILPESLSDTVQLAKDLGYTIPGLDRSFGQGVVNQTRVKD